MLPLVIAGIAAGVGALLAYGGTAISNWTSNPTQTIEDTGSGIDYYGTQPSSNSSGIQISNTTLLIAGVALFAIMSMRK